MAWKTKGVIYNSLILRWIDGCHNGSRSANPSVRHGKRDSDPQSGLLQDTRRVQDVAGVTCLAEQFGIAYAPTYGIVFTFLIMVLALAYRPQGLLGGRR